MGVISPNEPRSFCRRLPQTGLVELTLSSNRRNMRRVRHFERQTADRHWRSRARMLSMARENTPRFPSFWQLQAIGWGSLYAWGLLCLISGLRNWSGAFRVNTLAIAFMFLNSIALRPVCRSLLRRSTDWLGFILRTAA